MRIWLLLGLAILMSATSSYAGDLPDHAITPGAINPEVTQQNIDSTVCVRGWTKTVRPPVYYTNKLKKIQIREYGYVNKDPRDYEEDHLIPLALGGHPTDSRNLWPQPRKSEWNAQRKDDLEFALYMAVCKRRLSLDEARSAFATNWIEAYRRYGGFLRQYHHGAVD